MKEADRTLVELARTQRQVFTRARARDAGLSTDAIRRRLVGGDLVAVGTHTLTFGGVVLDWRGELQAGLLDLGPHALVSAHAAAALLELDGYDEGHHEYLTLRGERNRLVRGHLATTTSIKRSDRSVVDGLAVTSATRCIIELIGAVTVEQLGNALDSACRMGLTTERVVSQRLDELGRRGRKGVRDLELLLRDVGVQSWLERAFLRGIAGTGLPRPTVQKVHRRAGEHVARVDFDFSPIPVIVEVGGRRGYSSYAERQRQEHRQRAAAARQDRLLLHLRRRDQSTSSRDRNSVRGDRSVHSAAAAARAEGRVDGRARGKDRTPHS